MPTIFLSCGLEPVQIVKIKTKNGPKTAEKSSVKIHEKKETEPLTSLPLEQSTVRMPERSEC